MCVILATKKKRIPAWALKRAEARNPHGIGIAWPEGGHVRWEKSISLERVTKLAAEVPKPYVVHFRWATVGPKTPILCHPFPVTKKITDSLHGKSKMVMFHNGTFRGMEDEIPEDGIWSDSRLFAHLLAHDGHEVMNQIGNNRVAIVRHKHVELHGPGWSTAKGFAMSNTRWLEKPRPVITRTVADWQRLQERLVP